MENQHEQPDRRASAPPILKINLLEAIAAIVIIAIFVMGFHTILPLAGYAVYLVIGVALAYAGLLGYHTFRYRQQLAAIDLEKQQTLVERERIVNEQEKARALSLIQPDTRTGNYPIWIDQFGQAHVFQPGNVVQPVPHSLTYSPTHHVDYRLSGGKEIPALPEPPHVAGLLPFPEPFTLTEVIRQHGISIDRIFLAMGRGEKPLFCDLDNYMHIAQSGPTGSGKTTQWRAEMALLLKAGVMVYLANPHFAPVVLKRGKVVEDWRPIGAALERQSGLPGDFPALMYGWEEIARFLSWLVREIDRRMEARRRQKLYGNPIYAFLDEWPGIVDWGRKCKDGRGKPIYDCGGDLAQIIRRGRAVEVFVSLNSQGFNVQEIGISGAARENFQTAYFLGGDPVSAAALLDIKQTEFKQLCTDLAQQDGLALGKGVAFFRNGQVSPDVQPVRLGLADDEFLYYLFGHEDHWSLPDRPEWIEKPDMFVSAETPDDETFLPQIETRASARGETREDFLETKNVSADPDELSGKVAAVSGETKRLIKRLIDKTALPWRDIAERAGLGGENYRVFRAVVAEMGYNTSVRRSGKGGQHA